MKKSYTADWPSDAPTPGQLKEFFNQIQVGRITKEGLHVFLRDGGVLDNEALARDILGDDFISPSEVATARGLAYTKEQLGRFTETLPSIDELSWCKANGYAIVPGPPTPMGMLEVRALKPALFYSETAGWYSAESEKFSRDDKATCEWSAIRKDIVPGSTYKTWDEQRRLLASEEYIPNAGEFAWFVTTFYMVRGVRFFGRIYARTSSLVSVGALVVIGSFDGKGLDVNDCWDDCRNDVVALASARKFIEASKS